MNKIVILSFLLYGSSCVHAIQQTPPPLQENVLNRNVFFDRLKANNEKFNDFSIYNYEKWLDYFHIYASANPSEILKSLEEFQRNVCERANASQSGACHTLFTSIKNNYKTPEKIERIQKVLTFYHNNQKAQESWAQKILDEHSLESSSYDKAHETRKALTQKILDEHPLESSSYNDTQDVLNQDVFFDTLKKDYAENFNNFESHDSQKWQKYFFVYASANPSDLFQSLEKFKKNVCERATNNQKGACQKLFELIKNSYSSPATKKQIETVINRFHNAPDGREPFMHKILDAQPVEVKASNDTKDPLNQNDFFNFLEKHEEKFNDFSIQNSQKWQNYFYVYASALPKNSLQSFKKFEQTVCDKAEKNQINACKKLFSLMGTSFQKNEKQLEKLVLDYHNNPKKRASLLDKFLTQSSEQKSLNTPQPRTIAPVVQDTQIEHNTPKPQNVGAQKNPFSRLFGQKMLTAQDTKNIQTEKNTPTPQNINDKKNPPSTSFWGTFKKRFS